MLLRVFCSLTVIFCNFIDHYNCNVILSKISRKSPGLDYGPDGTSYGASILIEKAMDSRQDVILALKMNGKYKVSIFTYNVLYIVCIQNRNNEVNSPTPCQHMYSSV